MLQLKTLSNFMYFNQIKSAPLLVMSIKYKKGTSRYKFSYFSDVVFPTGSTFILQLRVKLMQELGKSACEWTRENFPGIWSDHWSVWLQFWSSNFSRLSCSTCTCMLYFPYLGFKKLSNYYFGQGGGGCIPKDCHKSLSSFNSDVIVQINIQVSHILA